VEPQADWAKQFEALLSSPLGKQLIHELTSLSASTFDSARQSSNMEEGYGLLKEAGGVIKAIEHLRFLAVVPKDKGSQDT